MGDGVKSVGEVRELVRAGVAWGLLSGVEVGPVWWDGQWWYVPADAPEGAGYVVADAEMAAEFERLRGRVQRINDVSGA